MVDKVRESRTFVVIIFLTVLGFAVWLFALFVLWSVLHSNGSHASFWAITEALSTAVAAAGVLGAGYVAYRELSEVSNSRYLEVADRLFNELNSAENIEARRWIYQNLHGNPEEEVHSMTPQGQAAVKQVLNSLDRVAFLTQKGWIPDELIMPWMHPMIVKSWEKLEPYVQYERHRRHEPYYYRYAGELAERCLTWRVTHMPNAKIAWIEDAL